MMMNPRITRGTLALFLLIAAGLACGSGTTTSETDPWEGRKLGRLRSSHGFCGYDDASRMV